MPALWELRKYGYLVTLWQKRGKLQGKWEFGEACPVWSKGENKMSMLECRLSEQACRKKICRLYPKSRRKWIPSRQSAKAGHIRKVQTVWRRWIGDQVCSPNPTCPWPPRKTQCHFICLPHNAAKSTRARRAGFMGQALSLSLTDPSLVGVTHLLPEDSLMWLPDLVTSSAMEGSDKCCYPYITHAFPLCPPQLRWLLFITSQLLPLKRLRQTKVKISFLHRPLY